MPAESRPALALALFLAGACGPAPRPQPPAATNDPTTNSAAEHTASRPSSTVLVLATDYHTVVGPENRPGWPLWSQGISERVKLRLAESSACLRIDQDIDTITHEIAKPQWAGELDIKFTSDHLVFAGRAEWREPILALTFHGQAEGKLREIELTCIGPELPDRLRCEVTSSYWPHLTRFRNAWLFPRSGHDVIFTGILEFERVRERGVGAE